jgi:hypothetical protein
MQYAREGELYLPPSEPSFWRGQLRAVLPRHAQQILAKYNPGVMAQEFSLGGAAKFIPAGSDIVFETHYVTNGKPEKEQSRVGIVFATETPSSVTSHSQAQQSELPNPCRRSESRSESRVDHNPNPKIDVGYGAAIH